MATISIEYASRPARCLDDMPHESDELHQLRLENIGLRIEIERLYQKIDALDYTHKSHHDDIT